MSLSYKLFSMFYFISVPTFLPVAWSEAHSQVKVATLPRRMLTPVTFDTLPYVAVQEHAGEGVLKHSLKPLLKERALNPSLQSLQARTSPEYWVRRTLRKTSGNGT